MLWNRTLKGISWSCRQLIRKNILLRDRICSRKFHLSRTPLFFFDDKIAGLNAPTKEDSSSIYHDGKSLLDRYIFVTTLMGYYEDVPMGIILDTAYGDSTPNKEFDPSIPVVLGLHDTPGTHHSMKQVLSLFAKLGCRTIAPTFPGHGETKGLMSGFDNVLNQSTEERTQFVVDFVRDLGIERVDLVVGVGAACYTVLNLCCIPHQILPFRSMALLSPWPLSGPRWQVDLKTCKKIQKYWDKEMFRSPVKMMMPTYKLGGAKTTQEKVTLAYLINNMDLGAVRASALTVCTMNIPRSVIFGEKDPEVNKQLHYDLLDALEIPKRNVTTFRGKLEVPLLPGALSFPEGGYDVHHDHTSFVSLYLLNMIRLFFPHIRI